MRIAVHVICSCLLGLVACGNPAARDNFDVTVEEMTSVPGATAMELLLDGSPVIDGLANFDLSDSNEFKDGQYPPDAVGSVRLTISVVSSDG